jgi:cell shape-determining protein MreD
MKVKAFAVAAGILWGCFLFAFTLLEASRPDQGHTLRTLSALYVGYSVTYPGSVVGLVYGFVSGALIGAAFCWLYNRFAGTRGEPKGKPA